MTEEPGTIIYSNSPNVQVADDQGNLHRAQLVAVASGEIVFNTPDNSPNVQVADDQGNLHRAQLVAMIGGGGGGGGAVSSVNGKTGAVVLDAEDVSATPQYSTIPAASSELSGQVIQYVGENTGYYKTGEFFKCTETIFQEWHPAVVVISNTRTLTVSVDRDTFFAYFGGYGNDWIDALYWATDHWEFVSAPGVPVDLQELGITCIGTPESGDGMYVIVTSNGYTYSADIMQTYKASGAIIDQDQFNNLMSFACGEATYQYPEDFDIIENIRWNRGDGVYGVFKYLNTPIGDCWCFVGSYSDADGETLFPSSEYGYICEDGMFPDMITSQDPSDWVVGESYIYVAVTSTQVEPVIEYGYSWEKIKVSPTDGLVKQIFSFPSEEITPYQRIVFQYAGQNPVTYDGVTFEPNYFYEYTVIGTGGVTPTSYTIDDVIASGLSADDISVDLDTLFAGLVNLYNNGGYGEPQKRIIEYIINGSIPLYLEWEEGYNFWLATLINGNPSYVEEIATTNADLAANYGITFPAGDYGSPYSITFTLYGGSISGQRWGYQQVNVQPGGGGTGDVVSVNGKTGVVVLDANDVSATPQYSEMPTATVDTLNKIVQYVGETNPNYTNGYFYKGVSEAGPVTYPLPCYISKGHSAILGDVSYDNESLTGVIKDIIPEVLDDIYTYKLLFEDDGSGNPLCNLYQVVDPSDPTQDVLLTTSYSPEDLGIFVDSYAIGDYLEFYSIGKNYRGMDINQGDTLIFGVDLDALETAFTTYIGFDILNSQVEDGIGFSFTHLENGYGDDPNLPWMYSWDNPEYGYVEGGLTAAEFASFGFTFETTPSQDEYFEIVSWPFLPIPGPTTYYWQQIEVQPTPDPLPDQTGNAGKFLTTDGTHTSWRTLSLTETITIPANGWSNNTQSVTVSIVTATNTVWVSPTPLCSEDYATASVMCVAQGNNQLTFTCTTTPVNDLTVSVVCL